MRCWKIGPLTWWAGCTRPESRANSLRKRLGSPTLTFPYHANYAGIDVMVKVAPETVGQYTGLLDKTNKRIFEGDITLARLAETVTRGYEGFERPPTETVFDNCAFCRKEQRQTLPFWNYVPHVEFEIIGTVYDNPELLEVRAE